MGDHDWVMVRLDNSCREADLGRTLVHGTLCRQPHADVKELTDVGFRRQEPHDPAQETRAL